MCNAELRLGTFLKEVPYDCEFHSPVCCRRVRAGAEARVTLTVY